MADYKEQYNAFIETLQSIFMMDHEELDFGIYRIMNYKREEINDFLKNKLFVHNLYLSFCLGSNNKYFPLQNNKWEVNLD